MKKQQNRGRADRRYQAAKRNRRKFECGCALCRNKWHAKPEDRFTIDREIGLYFDHTAEPVKKTPIKAYSSDYGYVA